MAFHSKVKYGASWGAGGIGLGALVAYIADLAGLPPMGDAVSAAVGGVFVWIANNVAGYFTREKVYRPLNGAPR